MDFVEFLNYTDEQLIIFKNQDDFEDIAIKASNKAGLTIKELLDTYFKEGVMAVYNLGMKHMYEYLEK